MLPEQIYKANSSLPAYQNSRTPRIWKEDYTVRSYEVDQQGAASIVTIANYIQNAAQSHAFSLGLAIQHLLPQRHTWMLSRLMIKMESYPAWQDQISLYTWPSGFQRLFALRDFRLTNQRDELIGAAISGWLVMDIDTRRPVRVKPFVDKISNLTFERALKEKLSKLQPMERHDEEQILSVRRADIDLNNHVNHVSYISWIMESMPEEILASGTLSTIEINYLGEALKDDRLVVKLKQLNQNRTQFFHTIAREEDGLEVVRARTEWKPLK